MDTTASYKVRMMSPGAQLEIARMAATTARALAVKSDEQLSEALTRYNESLRVAGVGNPRPAGEERS